ncbi:MAG: hypothetical protein M3Q10_18180 [Chloroflexota bacterium]|nr:hypothetical protein [Chloroflexota bacterium]
MTPIVERVQGAAPHAADGLVLATAVSGGADYLVTGDKGLLAVGKYRDVRIIALRAFLAVLGMPRAQHQQVGARKDGVGQSAAPVALRSERCSVVGDGERPVDGELALWGGPGLRERARLRRHRAPSILPEVGVRPTNYPSGPPFARLRHGRIGA